MSSTMKPTWDLNVTRRGCSREILGLQAEDDPPVVVVVLEPSQGRIHAAGQNG
jgi:hypothetical protein